MYARSIDYDEDEAEKTTTEKTTTKELETDEYENNERKELSVGLA